MQRGLSVAPARRFPSMEALLEVLEQGQRRSRVRKAAAGVTALGLVLAGAEGWRRWDRAQKVAACEATAQELGDAWSEEVAASVRSGLAGTGIPYAADAAERAVGYLAEQAEAWRSARVAACLASEVQRRWTPKLYARSRWCLEDRRLELGALARELASPPPSQEEARTVVQKAVQAASDLSRVAPCVDAARLSHLPDPPAPAQAPRLAKVRRGLSEADAKARSGRYEAGLAAAQRARSEAQDLGWPPLVARARAVEGALLDEAGKYGEAEASLEAAYFSSAADGAWETAARAAANLVHTVGDRRAEHAAGLRWGRHAQVVLARLGEPEDGLRRAGLFTQLAVVHEARGEFAQALALLERALSIRETSLGFEHPEVAEILNDLAVVHEARGEYEQARVLHERVLAIWETSLGPEHPLVATSLNNLANVYNAGRQYEQARVLYERALAIWETSLGPEHPLVAIPLDHLADVHQARGEYEQAGVLYERALAIWETPLRPEHPRVAQPLVGLAEVALARRAPGKAVPLAERAVAIRAAGEDSVSAEALAEARFVLARALWAAPAGKGRDRPRALSLAREALAAYEAAGEATQQERDEVRTFLAEHAPEAK